MAKNPWAIWSRGGRWSRFVEGTVVPKTFLPEIGHVVVAFSRLDSQLDMTIAYLLVNADRGLGGAIASAIPNYRPRIELFERVIDIKVSDPDDRKALHRLAKAIMQVAEKRHRLIHDYMSSFSHVDERLDLRRKEAMFRPSTLPTDITIPSLKELASQMTDLSFRLQRFTKDDPLWKSGAQFPWRDTPRKRSRTASLRQPSEPTRA